MTEPVPSAKDYGARYAGFVHEFTVGSGGRPGVQVGLAGIEVLKAATAAWEDQLIRIRRAENRAERDRRGDGP